MFPTSQNQMLLNKKFEEIKDIKNPQTRGYKFEELMLDLFRFYGLQPRRDRGVTKSGDQIDLIANFEGKHLIVETKFLKKPVDRTAIEKLNSKMEIRQPNTIGLYFSMSGFTKNAEKYVSDIIKKRTIVLFGENETKEILTSRLDFERLLRRKIFLQTKESKVALEIKEDEDVRLLSEDYHDIIINQTKVEYLTTKSKGIDCVLFSPIYYGFSDKNYWIELYYPDIQFKDLLFILRKYEDIFGFSDKSSYCINQTNYSWFGLGVESFLKALKNRAIRYKKTEDIKKHHSEAVVFIDEIPGRGLFSLSLQPEINPNRDRISHVSISFLLQDIPFPNSRYELFFKTLNNNPECIEVINNTVETRLELEEDFITIKKVGFLKLKNDFYPENEREEWSDGIICKNPFYNKKIDFPRHNNYFFNNRGIQELFATLENFIIFLPHYESVDSHHKYHLREVRLLSVPSSGFSSICINPIGDWLDH